MSKGNEQNNSKKNIQYIAFTTIILIIIATLIIVKTYFSKADKWIILKNSSSDKISTSYSILTQNLFAKSSFLQSDLTNVTSLVEENKSDIICLQEANNDWINHLSTFFSNENYDVIYKYSDSGAQTCASPIYYNSDIYTLVDSGYFWLSDTPNIQSNLWNENKPYIITWAELKHSPSNSEFVIININLSKNTDSNKKSLDCINNYVKTHFTKKKIILAGTFNFPISSSSYKDLSNRYNDLSTISNKLYNVNSSYLTNESSSQNASSLDYIFGSKDIKCDKFALLKTNDPSSNTLSHTAILSNIYFENINNE